MEIIYIDKKSIGPSTDPWGIPQLTDTGFVDVLFIVTNCFRSLRYDINQLLANTSYTIIL